MVQVGIRELKARLSYYVQLMQSGETIAIKTRDRVVGFLTQQEPVKKKPRRSSRKTDDELIQEMVERGELWGGKRYRHRPFKGIRMTPGPSISEMVRMMRDEEI